MPPASTATPASTTSPAPASTGGMQSYTYIDSAGKSQSVTAANADEALKNAPNIAAHSGVILQPNAITPGPAPAIQTTDSQRANTSARSAALSTTLGKIAPAGTQTTTTGTDNSAAPADGSGTQGTDGGAAGGTASITHDVTNTDGTHTLSYSDGSTKNVTATKGADGSTSYQEVQSDPLKAQVDSIRAAGAAQIAQVQSNLTRLMGTSSESTGAMITQIQQMYGDRITAMQQTNAKKEAVDTQLGMRNGDARYATAAYNAGLTDDEVQGNIRIANLQAQMMTAIQKAQSAQDAGDTKSFNDAFDQIDSITKDTEAQVNDLYKQAVAQSNQQLKESAASAKDTQTSFANGLKVAAAAAPGLADQLGQFKDPADQAAFITEFAEQNGVDPSVVWGEVEKAMQAKQKSDASLQNIASEIQKRNEPKAATGGSSSKPIVSGSTTYTKADIGQLQTMLSTGGTLDGTRYNGKGGDGYVDPDFYEALANQWVAKGGAIKDFLKEMPAKDYVNPAAKLPTYLGGAKPKAGAAGSTPGGRSL